MAELKGGTIGILIGVFIALLLGLILVAIVADQTYPKTVQSVASQTINLAPARLPGGQLNATYYFHLTEGCPGSTSDWRYDSGECALTDLGVKNGTGGLVTATTDYVLVTKSTTCSGVNGGDIRFPGLSASGTGLNLTSTNTTTVTYGYCADDYMTQSWVRTVLNLIPGFFGLALFIGSAFVIFWILKKEGITDFGFN